MLVEEVFVQLDRDARGRSARVGPFFISVSAIGLAPPPRSTAFYFGVGDRTRAATEEHRILFRCRRSDSRRHLPPAKLTNFSIALKLLLSFKLIFQARKIRNRSTENYGFY